MWISSLNSQNTSVSDPLPSEAEKPENHVGRHPAWFKVTQLASVGPRIRTHEDQYSSEVHAVNQGITLKGRLAMRASDLFKGDPLESVCRGRRVAGPNK